MTLMLLLGLGCNRGEGEAEVEGDEAGECDDGADNDQDGLFDCEDQGCFGSPACGEVEDTGEEDPTDDKDEDGFTIEDGDCDDNDPLVNPGAVEVCNGRDDDCNGDKDDDPIDGEVYYQDHDGDGYGDPSNTTEACDKPSQYADNDDDCDDNAKDAHPGGIETDWDGIDQDCDGYDVNLEACVIQSVADATDWVSWWSYSVSDDSANYAVAGYDLYGQTLYVDADSHNVEPEHDAPLNYSVTVDSLQALNTYEDPFYLDAWLFTTDYWCDGYVDWTEVTYSGDIETQVSGQTVTAQVSLTSSWSGYVQDSVVLWNYATGGSCDVQTADTVLSYGGYSILDFFDSGFTDNAAEVADELETEIAWYVNYNCSAE